MSPFVGGLVAITCLTFSTAVQLRHQNDLSLSAVQPAERDTWTMHVVVLSDKPKGITAALNSVCNNTKNAERLHLHLVSNTLFEMNVVAPTCALRRANMTNYLASDLEAKIIEIYGPFRRWSAAQGATEDSSYAVPVVEWKTSDKTERIMALMRLYLPSVQPFRNMSKVIFMDDDVLVLKDVASAWDIQLGAVDVMTAPCGTWIRKDNLNDLPIQRPMDGMSSKFNHLLKEQSLIINGPNHAVRKEILDSQRSWRLGFNLVDLDNWRETYTTERCESWMQLNGKYKIIPERTLAYPLGILTLANMGRVKCYDRWTPMVQGLGFLGGEDERANAAFTAHLHEIYALHFNGPKKPWQFNFNKASHRELNPWESLFLAYTNLNVIKDAGSAEVGAIVNNTLNTTSNDSAIANNTMNVTTNGSANSTAAATAGANAISDVTSNSSSESASTSTVNDTAWKRVNWTVADNSSGDVPLNENVVERQDNANKHREDVVEKIVERAKRNGYLPKPENFCHMGVKSFMPSWTYCCSFCCQYAGCANTEREGCVGECCLSSLQKAPMCNKSSQVSCRVPAPGAVQEVAKTSLLRTVQTPNDPATQDGSLPRQVPPLTGVAGFNATLVSLNYTWESYCGVDPGIKAKTIEVTSSALPALDATITNAF